MSTGKVLTQQRVFLTTAPWSYASLAGRAKPGEGGRFRRDVSGQGVLPSLGLHYLASALEGRGHIANVVEGYGTSRDELLKRMQAFSPDVVGITLQTPLWPATQKLLDGIKQHLPNTRIAVGGAHANMHREKLLEKAPQANAVFVGPSEASFSQWVSSGKNGNTPTLVAPTNGSEPPSYEAGFAARVATRIPWANYIPNLMFLGHQRFATSVTTLGCASACSFCGLTRGFGGRAARSTNSVSEELRCLSQELGIRTVNYLDDNTLFAQRGDQIDAWLEELAHENLPIEWTIYLNDFQISEARLRLMKKANCRRVLLLVESGSQRVADIAHGRSVSVDAMATTIERADRVGIEVAARFQIGFPSETVTEGMESVDFALSMPLIIASFVRTLILPGSRIARRAIKAGTASADDEHWSYYGQPVPPDAMTRREQASLVRLGVRRFYGKQLLTGRAFRLPRILHMARRVLVDGTE